MQHKCSISVLMKIKTEFVYPALDSSQNVMFFLGPEYTPEGVFHGNQAHRFLCNPIDRQTNRAETSLAEVKPGQLVYNTIIYPI